ncbi:MAG: adenylyltransferase/cytidyltransferase family protein, partial [Thermoplasmata archaeon]|nr:adenylyltransferase/cytidyltransferase family protein [Thermoplasmata archaeon]
MRALVIGRFQPFHNGHLAVVREIAEDTEEVLIGIAAAADDHT